MPSKDLEIRCPDCGSRIRLDPATGAILGHGPGERPKDLGEAARRHAEKATGRDDAFRRAMDAERGRKQELEDLFKNAADKAARQDPGERPDRGNEDRWR
jgi:hypothetical protein